MKVAKTSVDEITSLLGPLIELEWLRKDLQRYELEDVEWDDYGILKELYRESAETFLKEVITLLTDIHFQRILMNCEVMLNHCADPNADTLEFNADITKGLELLREWVNAEPARRKDFPVERMKHGDLVRIGDSEHTSQCPSCDPGSLGMRRDPETHKLLPEDMCQYCGQRVVYTDVVDGELVAETA